MNADAAIEWLEVEGFDNWRLFRGDADGQKVSDFESDKEDKQTALDRLRRILPLQSAGKYTLKGWNGKHKQAAQSHFIFDIRPQPVVSQSQQSLGHRNHDIDEIRREAEKAAYLKLEAENWRKEVDKRLDALEKATSDIALSVKQLNDDDDENDLDALERITNVATKLPQLQSGLNAFKGMLKMS